MIEQNEIFLDEEISSSFFLLPKPNDLNKPLAPFKKANLNYVLPKL